MKNFYSITENLTGKKFMCLSLNENPETVEEWSNHFKINRTYNEAKKDAEGNNLVKNVDCGVLLLINDNGDTVYADKNNFVEVEGMHIVIKKMIIGLN